MSVAPGENNMPPGTAAHGWLAIGGERVEGGWRYPERNAQGERIGTITRWEAPASGARYTAAKGSKRGLIFPADGLPAYAGTSGRDPVLIAEGASDAVCLTSFGFTAIGVPMAGRGADDLAELVKDRHVVVLGDSDDAGRRSVETLCAALIDVCTSVRFAYPPDGHKDVRSWVADGCAGDLDLSKLIDEAEPFAPAQPESDDKPQASEFTPFPTDMLPRAATNLVRAGAEAMQVDEGMIAPLALAAMSAAIGNARVIELFASWREPAVLWAVVVAPSGSGKSPALELVTRPAERRDSEALREHREATKEHAAAMFLHERAMKAWERGAAKGNLADTPPPAPEPPLCERIVTNDATFEGLASMLAASPRGLLLACDELASWLGGFTRYAGNSGRPSSEAARWLPMHRAGSLKVDRKTSPPLRIEKAALNIAGLIQPGVLAAALTGTDFDSGLVARLLLSMPPTPTRRWRPGGLSPMVAGAFNTLMAKLYDLDMPEDERGTPMPRSLPLDEEAGQHWAEYYNELNQHMAGEHERTRAMLSKLEGGAARLALVVHLGRIAGGEDVRPDSIDCESMRRGITLAKWFRGEGERVYLRLAEGDGDRESRQLLYLIRRKGGSINGRELVQSSRAFRAVKDAEAALSRLVDAGHGAWVTPPQRGPGAPKARRFVLPGASGDPVYRNPAGDAAEPDSVCVDGVDMSDSDTDGGAA